MRAGLLLRNICMSFGAAACCGLALGLGVRQAERRGAEHYVQKMSDWWTAGEPNGRTPYRYACDMVSEHVQLLFRCSSKL